MIVFKDESKSTAEAEGRRHLQDQDKSQASSEETEQGHKEGFSIPASHKAEAWNQLAPWLPERSKTPIFFLRMVEALELFSRKQHDYTSLNIALMGEEGVFIRVTDKWARLFSHYRLGKTLLNESLKDTWLDLAIYSFIALMLIDHDWTLEPEELRKLGLKAEPDRIEARSDEKTVLT